jgi:hypothetical protein
MIKGRTYLLVMVWGMMLATLTVSRAADVVVKLDRVGDKWVAWFPHQTVGRWTIQVSTTGAADDWFTPPSYEDDGVRVYAQVPNVPKMFFRARRVN